MLFLSEPIFTAVIWIFLSADAPRVLFSIPGISINDTIFGNTFLFGWHPFGVSVVLQLTDFDLIESDNNILFL